MPALERGAAKAGKTRADLTVSLPGFVVTGADEESIVAADKGMRQQIAFYASTPAYRPVLELHGWGDLQSELNTLSKRGEWVQMGELIDDDVLRRLRRGVPRWTRWRPRCCGATRVRSTASASTRPTRCPRTSGRACWRGSRTEASAFGPSGLLVRHRRGVGDQSITIWCGTYFAMISPVCSTPHEASIVHVPAGAPRV